MSQETDKFPSNIPEFMRFNGNANPNDKTFGTARRSWDPAYKPKKDKLKKGKSKKAGTGTDD